MTDSQPPMSSTPPPPPPPVAGGAPYGQPVQGLRTASPLRLALAGIGLLAFVWSFLPYYRASLDGASASETAWHEFCGPAGAILALAAGVVAILPALRVVVPYGTAVMTALFALAFILTLIALFTFPDKGALHDAGVHTSGGVGYWLAFVFTLVGTAVSAYLFNQERSAGTLARA